MLIFKIAGQNTDQKVEVTEIPSEVAGYSKVRPKQSRLNAIKLTSGLSGCVRPVVKSTKTGPEFKPNDGHHGVLLGSG